MYEYLFVRRRDETRENLQQRLLAQHQWLLKQNRITEAMSFWEEYVPHYFRLIVGNEAHDYSKSSIVSSFMPKSGGTFLHNRMVADLGYKDFWWGLTDPGHPSSVFPSARGLVLYCLGGFTCHTHFTPGPSIIKHIDEVYREPIWVHIRNPISAAEAGFYHYRGLAQGTGAELAQRLRIIGDQIDQYHLDISNLDCFVEDNIKFYIGWLKEWKHLSAAFPERVKFTFFDEISDIDGFFTRLGQTFSIGEANWRISSELPHDRKRAASEVREVLDRSTVKRLQDKVASELAGFAPLERLLATN